jgi:hypothetical protein
MGNTILPGKIRLKPTQLALLTLGVFFVVLKNREIGISIMCTRNKTLDLIFLFTMVADLYNVFFRSAERQAKTIVILVVCWRLRIVALRSESTTKC